MHFLPFPLVLRGLIHVPPLCNDATLDYIGIYRPLALIGVFINTTAVQSSLLKFDLLFCRGNIGLLGLLVDTAKPLPHLANGSGLALSLTPGVKTFSIVGFSKFAILIGGGTRPRMPEPPRRSCMP